MISYLPVWIVFFWIFSGNTIKFNLFFLFFLFFVLFDYIAISNFFSVLYFHLFHMHVCFQSADCILFSSSALSTILLTSSANTLYFLLFILCCDFNWLSFNYFCKLFRLSTSILFFVSTLFYFQVYLLLDNFHNF